MSYRLPAPPPPPEQCLPGRDTTMPVRDTHAVLGTPLRAPWPQGMDTLIVGMGCFWGAERLVWEPSGAEQAPAGDARRCLFRISGTTASRFGSSTR